MKLKACVLIVCLTIFSTGCMGKGNVQEQRASNHEGDIVIGVAWPFAARNEGFDQGTSLALEEINASGGLLGRQVKLIKEDDESSVTRGMSIAQKFAANPEVVAVIGNRVSSVSVPSAAIYEQAGILMLTPGSSAPKLTQNGYKYVFRSIPSDEQIGKRMAKFALDKGYTKIAIIYADDEYGRGLANVFEDATKEYGIETIDRISNYSDTNELRRIKQEWMILDCDAVFIADVMPSGGQTITDLRRAGMDVPILGGDGLDSEDLFHLEDSAAAETVVASVFNLQDPRPEVSSFIEKYKVSYKGLPGKWAAQGYDAIRVLGTAITNANSTEPALIAKELRKLDQWQGVTGSHTFDANGDVQDKPVVLKKVRGNKFEYLN